MQHNCKLPLKLWGISILDKYTFFQSRSCQKLVERVMKVQQWAKDKTLNIANRKRKATNYVSDCVACLCNCHRFLFKPLFYDAKLNIGDPKVYCQRSFISSARCYIWSSGIIFFGKSIRIYVLEFYTSIAFFVLVE